MIELPAGKNNFFQAGIRLETFLYKVAAEEDRHG
jgi:hypothetical protein